MSQISFTFENGFIADSKSVGIALENETEDRLMELYFFGGNDDYSIRDGDGQLRTGIHWTQEGLQITLKLETPSVYTITINSSQGSFQWTRHLLNTTDQKIKLLRLWNYSAGDGEGYNLYLNNLTITGGQWADYDSILVMRTPTANDLDADGDGMNDAWEQRIIDADPNDSINTINDVLPDGNYDNDPMSNYAEYIAGSDPTDPDAFLLITDILNNPSKHVAVGTPVAGCPPPRSVRAVLPHTAPTLSQTL